MKVLVSVFVGLFSVFCTLNISAQNDTSKPINVGVVNGKAVNLVKPEYPPAAKAVNANGSVNVQVTIDEDGNVISALAVTGHPLLRSASEKAARESQFSPTKLSGKAVKVLGIIVYNYANSNPKIIDGGVINGKAINLPKPAYPSAAKAVGASGTVNVQVTIDEEGNVISAVANGHPLLQETSEKAAMEAKFEPTMLAGKAVKVTGVIVYRFAGADNDSKKVDGGVLNSKAISLPKPVYPPAARAVKASGEVSVQITIDEEGNVISAIADSGHPLLKKSAETAAKEAKFSPTILSGQAIKVSGILIYNFAVPKSVKK